MEIPNDNGVLSIPTVAPEITDFHAKKHLDHLNDRSLTVLLSQNQNLVPVYSRPSHEWTSAIENVCFTPFLLSWTYEKTMGAFFNIRKKQSPQHSVRFFLRFNVRNPGNADNFLLDYSLRIQTRSGSSRIEGSSPILKIAECRGNLFLRTYLHS